MSKLKQSNIFYEKLTHKLFYNGVKLSDSVTFIISHLFFKGRI